MILFPWSARVFDRSDGRLNVPAPFPSTFDNHQQNPELRAQSVTYYQTLIDKRDTPYIKAHTGEIALLLSKTII